MGLKFREILLERWSVMDEDFRERAYNFNVLVVVGIFICA